MNWELVQEATSRRDAEWGVQFPAEGRIRVALASPTRYYVGMSSLGFQAVYGMFNSFPDVVCERVFLPDEPNRYRKSRTALFSLESLSPVSSFDIVAFSVSYELELPGLFEVLELSGIPLRTRDRSPRHPLVIAGGPLTYANPLPLGPFVDAVVVGEAEPVVDALIEAIRTMAGQEKSAVLDALATLPGIWVPSRHGEDLPERLVADVEALPAASCRVTAETDLSNMFLIEAARGCSRGCRYCVMRRRPGAGMRVVPAARILSRIPEQATRVGLVGAAVSDHPALVSILDSLEARGLGVGVSSLRADRMTAPLVERLRAIGYRQLTVAADGASERLRGLLGRRIKEEHLLRTAELAAATRMSSLKVYVMLGVPEETDDDIDELIALSDALAEQLPVVLAVSFFVPKRGTPLSGASSEPIPELNRRAKRLSASVGRRVTVRPASARWAWVEYRLATGDMQTGMAALEAWRNGAGFSAWRRALG